MVGFQVPLGNFTEGQLLDRFFPDLERNEGSGSHHGVVTIVNSTTGEPREAIVRVSTYAGVLHGRPYAEMARPWVRVGAEMYDLPGVLPEDYTDLATETLHRLLSSKEFVRGIFTLLQEVTPPFLTWSPGGVVVHQYYQDPPYGGSEWVGLGYDHLSLAEAVLPMLDGMGILYDVERVPLSSTS